MFQFLFSYVRSAFGLNGKTDRTVGFSIVDLRTGFVQNGTTKRSALLQIVNYMEDIVLQGSNAPGHSVIEILAQDGTSYQSQAQFIMSFVPALVSTQPMMHHRRATDRAGECIMQSVHLRPRSTKFGNYGTIGFDFFDSDGFGLEYPQISGFVGEAKWDFCDQFLFFFTQTRPQYPPPTRKCFALIHRIFAPHLSQ